MNELLAYAVGALPTVRCGGAALEQAHDLVKYGTEGQGQKWLILLVERRMESELSMTEPHNSGSDSLGLDVTAPATATIE